MLPNKDAIPAATIPLGPTQLINSFSLNCNLEFTVLPKTAKGLITKTIIANKAAVFQVYNNIKSFILMLAANKINRIEINKTLKDSLK